MSAYGRCPLAEVRLYSLVGLETAVETLPRRLTFSVRMFVFAICGKIAFQAIACLVGRVGNLFSQELLIFFIVVTDKDRSQLGNSPAEHSRSALALALACKTQKYNACSTGY